MKKIAASGHSVPPASMKFLLEFFTSCCGQRQSEDKRLLSAPEYRRSMSVKLDGDSPHHEWKPSLVSISEDDIFAEDHHIVQPAAERGRSLKRQVSSSSPRRATYRSSSDGRVVGRVPASTVVRPTLVSSRSFMF